MPDTATNKEQPYLFGDDELTKTSGPIERAVLEALANPQWDYRTVFGIAKETGLPEREVKAVLETWPQIVRRSAVPGRNGQALYTLRMRPKTRAEKIALLRAFLTKSV